MASHPMQAIYRATPQPLVDNQALSILIVEDEPGDHALVVTYLRHKSFRRGAQAPNLVWAKTLAEGIATGQSTAFDLVLLDLSLPDSMGVKTVTAMTAALPDTPVVVLTGNDDDELALAALGAGAQERRLHLFEVALNSAANGIIITDVDGCILWANEAFAQVTGFSVAESIGTSPANWSTQAHTTKPFTSRCGKPFWRDKPGVVKSLTGAKTAACTTNYWPSHLCWAAMARSSTLLPSNKTSPSANTMSSSLD